MDSTADREVLDAALTLIHSRQHTSPKRLGDPGPDREQIEKILSAAGTVLRRKSPRPRPVMADYTAKLAAAGFENIAIEPTRIYNVEDARQFLAGQGIDVDAIAAQVDGKFMSAFVRATKG
jgi:hypothetical protein